MTWVKASALTAGFVGAVALGAAIGPSITERLSDREKSATVTESPAAADQAKPAAERAPRARAASRTASTAAKTTADAPVAVAANAVRADEPRVQERLKPVLNRGTKMEVAAQGFLTAEEFATVAHAAKNTSVPFMVLKHRVLSEKRPLEDSVADAIRDLKPELNAKAEVARAKSDAKADLADISGE
jgi:hypothetical protein